MNYCNEYYVFDVAELRVTNRRVTNHSYIVMRRGVVPTKEMSLAMTRYDTVEDAEIAADLKNRKHIGRTMYTGTISNERSMYSWQFESIRNVYTVRDGRGRGKIVAQFEHMDDAVKFAFKAGGKHFDRHNSYEFNKYIGFSDE